MFFATCVQQVAQFLKYVKEIYRKLPHCMQRIFDQKLQMKVKELSDIDITATLKDTFSLTMITTEKKNMENQALTVWTIPSLFNSPLWPVSGLRGLPLCSFSSSEAADTHVITTVRTVPPRFRILNFKFPNSQFLVQFQPPPFYGPCLDGEWGHGPNAPF